MQCEKEEYLNDGHDDGDGAEGLAKHRDVVVDLGHAALVERTRHVAGGCAVNATAGRDGLLLPEGGVRSAAT